MPVKDPNIIRIVNHSSLTDLSSITSTLFPKQNVCHDGSTWHISNKYYSASVKFTLKDNPSSLTPGGVLVYFDTKSVRKFDNLELLKDFEESEVKLIVAHDPKASLSPEFLSSIPTHGWELVDLSEEYDEEDESSSIGGQIGVGRISEALQTVPWEPNDESGSLTQLNSEQDEEKELESFEKLFAQFASLKSHASSLSGDERKKYTEKVVMSFWRAMGGDEEEIAGLSDDDDEGGDECNKNT